MNYMENIETFKRFLASENLYMHEIPREDGVVFRVEQKLECGIVVPAIVAFYYEIEHVDVFVFDYVSINNPLRKEIIHSLINSLNAEYRFTKFYEEDNQVSLKISLMFNGNFDPSSVVTSLVMLLRSADESYSKFMKVLWA